MLSRPTSLLKEPGTGEQINRSISWLPLGIPSCCPGFPMDMPGVHTWWYMAEEEHNLKKPTYSHLCTLNTEQMDQEPQTEVVLPKILSKIPWVRSPWNPLLCVQNFYRPYVTSNVAFFRMLLAGQHKNLANHIHIKICSTITSILLKFNGSGNYSHCKPLLHRSLTESCQFVKILGLIFNHHLSRTPQNSTHFFPS